jgi:uncharacterized protein YcfL
MRRLATFLAAAVLAVAAGCSSTPAATASPAQQAVNTTAETCKNVVAAIKAANQAVVAGVLKGDNARAALNGLTAAQTGCETALASIMAANATATGAPK